MITTDIHGRTTEMSGLTDKQLADELARVASRAESIERISVVRQRSEGETDDELRAGNRHERRRRAALARRQR